MNLEQGLAVLEDLEGFCRAMGVRGQVTFTGGNPLLHPHFDALYAQTARRGFSLGILGNPTPGPAWRASCAWPPCPSSR